MAAKQELYAPQEPKGTGDRRNLSVKPQPDQYEDKELWADAFIDSLIDADNVDDEQRQAAKVQLKQLITQKQLEARTDELKDLKALHSRTYTQKVTDNMGNEYVSDTHSYISSYETQERIAKLEAELTKQGGKG